jgi:phosphohistidine phosphatase
MSERTLILFRHAKSDQSSSEADIDRPLNPRGQRQAPETGRWLAENVDGIDLAVVSPAHRARTTWELASAELGRQPETRVDDRVYNASVPDLLDVIHDLPDDARTVVLVGHNPGTEDLASLLTNESVSLPTAAIAVLGSDAAWSSAGESWASLRESGRPPA